MTTRARANLIAAGIIRPQPVKHEVRAVRRADCLTQRDVLARKADAALCILEKALQRVPG